MNRRDVKPALRRLDQTRRDRAADQMRAAVGVDQRDGALRGRDLATTERFDVVGVKDSQIAQLPHAEVLKLIYLFSAVLHRPPPQAAPDRGSGTMASICCANSRRTSGSALSNAVTTFLPSAVPPQADERIERGDLLVAAPASDTTQAIEKELHWRI